MELNPEFIRRIREQLGGASGSLLGSLDSVPPVSVRLHPQKGGGLFPGSETIPWCEQGRYLNERPSFTLDPAFHAGAYYVQEASSMLLGYVIGSLLNNHPSTGGPQSAPRTFYTVLDACAAPGGKTTLLASALPGSFIVANEVIRSRVPALTENVIKWGGGNVAVTSSEAAKFAALPGFFDLIVADVPCSGEGLFRKQPGARAEWSPENARHCSLRQRKILSDLWPALASGGFLIYSTCTFNPEENERNLAWFSGQTGAQSIKSDMPADIAVTTVSHEDVTGYYCYPDKVKGEGFFIAVIRKEDGHSGQEAGSGHHDGITAGRDNIPAGPGNVAGRPESAAGRLQDKRTGNRGVSLTRAGKYKGSQGKHSGSGHIKTPFEMVQRAESDRLAGWFRPGPDADFQASGYESGSVNGPEPGPEYRQESGNPLKTGIHQTGHLFIRYGRMIHRIADRHLSRLTMLHQAMPVRYAGTETAELIRGEAKPAHPAALSPDLIHRHFATAELDLDQALSFLRTEPLPPRPGPGDGWMLARYNGLGLGWLKQAGNRLNNHYPRNWRIRMQG
jgi:16S rRNA C967 or C1407 C5-methylase (RsmB/RsmF family)